MRASSTRRAWDLKRKDGHRRRTMDMLRYLRAQIEAQDAGICGSFAPRVKREETTSPSTFATPQLILAPSVCSLLFRVARSDRSKSVLRMQRRGADGEVFCEQVEAEGAQAGPLLSVCEQHLLFWLEGDCEAVALDVPAGMDLASLVNEAIDRGVRVAAIQMADRERGDVEEVEVLLCSFEGFLALLLQEELISRSQREESEVAKCHAQTTERDGADKERFLWRCCLPEDYGPDAAAGGVAAPSRAAQFGCVGLEEGWRYCGMEQKQTLLRRIEALSPSVLETAHALLGTSVDAALDAAVEAQDSSSEGPQFPSLPALLMQFCSWTALRDVSQELNLSKKHLWQKLREVMYSWWVDITTAELLVVEVGGMERSSSSRKKRRKKKRKKGKRADQKADGAEEMEEFDADLEDGQAGHDAAVASASLRSSVSSSQSELDYDMLVGRSDTEVLPSFEADWLQMKDEGNTTETVWADECKSPAVEDDGARRDAVARDGAKKSSDSRHCAAHENHVEVKADLQCEKKANPSRPMEEKHLELGVAASASALVGEYEVSSNGSRQTREAFSPSPHPSFILNSQSSTQAEPLAHAVPSLFFSSEEQRLLSEELRRDINDMASELCGIARQRQPRIKAVVQSLRGLVGSVWAGARLETYGSFATGLSVPSSDVDLVLTGFNGTWWGPSGPPLDHLASLLRQQSWVQSVRSFPSASMPVLKVCCGMVSGEGGAGESVSGGVIHVDITCADDVTGHRGPPHRGVETCVFVQRLCKMMPQLKPLVLVLKQFLKEQGLNDTYTGGLSSYGLVVMTAAVLNLYALQPPQVRPDVGSLFIIFMAIFSSRNFDTRQRGISMAPNGPLVEISPLHFPQTIPRVNTPEWWQPADPVLIQDPLQPNNNVGRSCYGFRQVQNAFDNVLERLGTWHERKLNGQHEFAGTALGAVFNTAHHASITRLTRAIWCPVDFDALTMSEGNGSPDMSNGALTTEEDEEELVPQSANLEWLRLALERSDVQVLRLLCEFGFSRDDLPAG